MTNLALAISIDPQFPELAQELVFMGGSLSPQTDDPEFVNNPRHEFNFWFDPEAAEIVLRAPWKKIVCTPTDISIKTRLTPAMVKQIEASGTPLARYIAKFAMLTPGADIMWDELAAARLDRSFAHHQKRERATWPSIWTAAPAMATRSPGSKTTTEDRRRSPSKSNSISTRRGFTACSLL